LVKHGLRIRDRLGEVISIAKPETLLAWHRRQKQKKWTFDHGPKNAGRPRKSEDTEALIVRLAVENGAWGYKRISGELKKLGSPGKFVLFIGRGDMPMLNGRDVVARGFWCF
jgi:putative transposase